MIPLTSDVVFKAVFLRNENVLIKLIKDIFDILEIDKPFTIIGFETLSYKKDGKTYRGDILIKLSDYSYVLVEMNHQTDPDVIDRNMVNLTRIHSQMLERGEGDSELKKYRLRGINFNNFRNKTVNPVEKYAICNIDTGKIVT